MKKYSPTRRKCFKQGALGAGALLLGTRIFGESLPEVKPRPLRIPEDRANGLKARLLANENPYGPSPKTVEAVAEAAAQGNRYVYSDIAQLVESIAKKEGVKPEQVMVAPGSTDILEKFAVSVCSKGGNIISADPGYMSIVGTSVAIGAEWKDIPLNKKYEHDLKAMKKAVDADTKLVYICNPNNPTGTLTPADDLRTFTKEVATKAPVFVDEAYIEFTAAGYDDSLVGLVAEGHDVLVCRTFSKIHGMAGLRVGYVLAQPERIEAMKEIFKVYLAMSVTALKGAMASIQDEDFLATTKAKNTAAREFTFATLTEMGMKPIPSHTSFILFPIDRPTDVFSNEMRDLGVGIRTFEVNKAPYCRVSMGTMDEMKIFVDALKTVMA